MRHIPVVCIVSAVSNTGKTTLTERLIAELVRRGYKAGAVKSDCHGFQMDVPGKDSWRFAEAGAKAVAVIGNEQFALIQQTSEKKDLDTVIRMMDDIDIVLVEGFKLAGKPKIEVVRRERGSQIVSPETDLVALVTDIEDLPATVPKFKLNDYGKIADLIEHRFLNKVQTSSDREM